MRPTAPALSTVLVVGPRRSSGQRVLDALGAQTQRDRMEIVVVDVAASRAARLTVPPGARTVYLERPSAAWGQLRLEGARHTSAPIVAFIEDHCMPAPGWAAALIEAHQGPWAAVGYAFTCANPDTYVSRAGLVVEYGPWLHPARHGRTGGLPGNNVSYKRDVLLALADELDLTNMVDFNIHEALVARGGRLFTESRAQVAHENFTTLNGLLGASHVYMRTLGAARAHSQAWSVQKRLAYGLSAPIVVPPLRLARLFRDLRGRPGLIRRALGALPLLLLVYTWCAAAEGLSYLIGSGGMERTLTRWEVEVERTPNRGPRPTPHAQRSTRTTLRER